MASFHSLTRHHMIKYFSNQLYLPQRDDSKTRKKTPSIAGLELTDTFAFKRIHDKSFFLKKSRTRLTTFLCLRASTSAETKMNPGNHRLSSDASVVCQNAFPCRLVFRQRQCFSSGHSILRTSLDSGCCHCHLSASLFPYPGLRIRSRSH